MPPATKARSPQRMSSSRAGAQGSEAGGERDPDVAAERAPVVNHEGAEDRGGDGDPREHEDDRPVERPGLPAVAPEHGQHGQRNDRIRGGHHEERHAVPEDRFGCFVHWAAKWYAEGSVRA